MNHQVNIVVRQAIDDAASAIKSFARMFTDDRTPMALRNDLDVARGRLVAALENVDTALRFLPRRERS